jgi:hypothetical protein
MRRPIRLRLTPVSLAGASRLVCPRITQGHLASVALPSWMLPEQLTVRLTAEPHRFSPAELVDYETI